jgi:hypothetical protein
MHPLEGPLDLKFFADEGGFPPPAEFVPVFHRWIQTGRLADELLIDVADYAHVHQGPGIVLVGHEAFYSVDQQDGRPGLLCRLRRSAPGQGPSRVKELFRRGLRARLLLEAEPAFLNRLRFRNDELRLRVHDLPVPPERAMDQELSSFLADLLAASVRVERLPPSKQPFGIRIQLEGIVEASRILERLGDAGRLPGIA